MRWQIAVGSLVLFGCLAGPERSWAEEVDHGLAVVEVAAPFYAYGPEVAEAPRIRPRFIPRSPSQYQGQPNYGWRGYSPRLPEQRYGSQSAPGRYRSFAQRGQAYGGYGYRVYRPYGAYANRRYPNRSDQVGRFGRDQSRYDGAPPRRSSRDRYASRIITPGWNGRWRDLGPVGSAVAD